MYSRHIDPEPVRTQLHGINYQKGTAFLVGQPQVHVSKLPFLVPYLGDFASIEPQNQLPCLKFPICWPSYRDLLEADRGVRQRGLSFPSSSCVRPVCEKCEVQVSGSRA